MSINSCFIDISLLCVDEIDLFQQYVDLKTFYRHIAVMCRLNRRASVICRYFTKISTGLEYMSISSTRL